MSLSIEFTLFFHVVLLKWECGEIIWCDTQLLLIDNVKLFYSLDVYPINDYFDMKKRRKMICLKLEFKLNDS